MMQPQEYTKFIKFVFILKFPCLQTYAQRQRIDIAEIFLSYALFVCVLCLCLCMHRKRFWFQRPWLILTLVDIGTVVVVTDISIICTVWTQEPVAITLKE